jgi:outer membrane translocation and assembly module TamA
MFYSGHHNRGRFSSNRSRRFLQDLQPAYELPALPPAEYLTFASYFKEDDGFIENPDMYAARIGAEVLTMLAHRNTFMEDLDGQQDLDGAETTDDDFSS